MLKWNVYEIFYFLLLCAKRELAADKGKFNGVEWFRLTLTSNPAIPAWESIWRIRRTSRSMFCDWDDDDYAGRSALENGMTEGFLMTTYLLILRWLRRLLAGRRRFARVRKLRQLVSYHCECVGFVGGGSRRRRRFSARWIHCWSDW